VILSTSYGQDGAAQEIFDGGAAGFIQKPYQIVPLLAKVKTILEA
jgi:CheY-like chemotaxis protein